MSLKIVSYHNSSTEIMISAREALWSTYENKMHKKSLNAKKNLFWLTDLSDRILLWPYPARHALWFWKFLSSFNLKQATGPATCFYKMARLDQLRNSDDYSKNRWNQYSLPLTSRKLSACFDWSLAPYCSFDILFPICIFSRYDSF